MNSKIYFETFHTASIQKNGFFIFDASRELSKEELNEIERIGTYQSFENDLIQPTLNEIKEFFPTCLAYHRLKSNPNRKVLFYSNYTGQVNHTPDRYGNFFTHTVIFESDKLDFSFKQFFDNFEWKKILTIEEDKNYKPNLTKSEYSFEKNTQNKEADFKYFADFLDYSERIQLFIKVIDEIFTFKILQKGKNITIVDTKENLNNWMLCINYFLPNDLAELITFASYVKSPEPFPFKLTGVVPECNISNLSNDFMIFDIKQNNNYEATSIYTKTVINIISNGESKDWLTFQENIKNLNYNQLTEFLKRYNYILNIGKDSSVDDYSVISNSLPIEKKQEIWTNAHLKDIVLYNNIVKIELERKLDNGNSFLDYKKEFLELYETFFKEKEKYRIQYLDDIINTFIKLAPIHNNKDLYVHILRVANCNTELKNQLMFMLQSIDSDLNFYFENIEENVEIVQELDVKYSINSLNFEIPNFKKIMKFRDIILEAKKDNFLNEIRKHNDFLQDASVKEKRKLFLIAFNNDKYFLKKNFSNFLNHIELVNHYLKDDYATFWSEFFDNNRDFEKNKDYAYHSLAYLKKKFVADVFLSEYNNLVILDKIDFTNEYDMKWINETVTEGTDRDAVLNRFLDYFKNNRYIDNNKSWFSNLNPFKK